MSFNSDVGIQPTIRYCRDVAERIAGVWISGSRFHWAWAYFLWIFYNRNWFISWGLEPGNPRK